MQEASIEKGPITLGPLGRKDRGKGIKLVARTFAHLAPEKHIIRALRLVDEDLSLALRRNGELVGVYLVRKKSSVWTCYDGFVPPYYADFKDMKVESLAILPSLRRQGYGRLLRSALPAMAKRKGFDFIWGAAFNTLGNKQDWLKRRILENESDHGFVTLEPLSEDMRKLVAPKATAELLARWNSTKGASDRTIEGQLIIETTAEKDRIPWLITDDGAYCGDPLGEEAFRAVRHLQGAKVRVSGRIHYETFVGSIVPTAPTAAQEPAPNLTPS